MGTLYNLCFIWSFSKASFTEPSLQRSSHYQVVFVICFLSNREHKSYAVSQTGMEGCMVFIIKCVTAREGVLCHGWYIITTYNGGYWLDMITWGHGTLSQLHWPVKGMGRGLACIGSRDRNLKFKGKTRSTDLLSSICRYYLSLYLNSLNAAALWLNMNIVYWVISLFTIEIGVDKKYQEISIQGNGIRIAEDNIFMSTLHFFVARQNLYKYFFQVEYVTSLKSIEILGLEEVNIYRESHKK